LRARHGGMVRPRPGEVNGKRAQSREGADWAEFPLLFWHALAS
jgi:hypothetical protein